MTLKAPEFSLQDQQGKHHSLQDYRGKWVVIFFYPKDNTPGCTKEVCSFRDNFELLKAANTVVLGISKDPIVSHQKFAQKHKLPFPLLSDQDNQVAKAFGAWGEKKFMGKTYTGTQRNTYLINPKGEIVKSYIKVNPLTHVKQLIEAINQEQMSRSRYI